MTRLLGVLGILLLVALTPVSFAQDENHVSKVDINLTEQVVVGDTTLTPGEYRFECQMIDGKHVMAISHNEKEVARVQCTRVDLPSKVRETSHRTMRRDDVKVLSEVRIKGESFGHRLVP